MFFLFGVLSFILYNFFFSNFVIFKVFWVLFLKVLIRMICGEFFGIILLYVIVIFFVEFVINIVVWGIVFDGEIFNIFVVNM